MVGKELGEMLTVGLDVIVGCNVTGALVGRAVGTLVGAGVVGDAVGVIVCTDGEGDGRGD